MSTRSYGISCKEVQNTEQFSLATILALISCKALEGVSLTNLALHVLECFQVQSSYTISLLPLFPTVLPLESSLHATKWMPCTSDQTISAGHIFPDFNGFSYGADLYPLHIQGLSVFVL